MSALFWKFYRSAYFYIVFGAFALVCLPVVAYRTPAGFVLALTGLLFIAVSLWQKDTGWYWSGLSWRPRKRRAGRDSLALLGILWGHVLGFALLVAGIVSLVVDSM